LLYVAAKIYTAFHYLRCTLLLDVFYKVRKVAALCGGCDLVSACNGRISF